MDYWKIPTNNYERFIQKMYTSRSFFRDFITCNQKNTPLKNLVGWWIHTTRSKHETPRTTYY